MPPGFMPGGTWELFRMDTSQIELHFFLAAFAEMVILSALIATVRARKKMPQKKFRVLMALEIFALWMLGTLLLAIGLALWISTDL